jgi:hypothetical protein
LQTPPFVVYSLDTREEGSPRPALPEPFPLPLIVNQATATDPQSAHVTLLKPYPDPIVQGDSSSTPRRQRRRHCHRWTPCLARTQPTTPAPVISPPGLFRHKGSIPRGRRPRARPCTPPWPRRSDLTVPPSARRAGTCSRACAHAPAPNRARPCTAPYPQPPGTLSLPSHRSNRPGEAGIQTSPN